MSLLVKMSLTVAEVVRWEDWMYCPPFRSLNTSIFRFLTGVIILCMLGSLAFYSSHVGGLEPLPLRSYSKGLIDRPDEPSLQSFYTLTSPNISVPFSLRLPLSGARTSAQLEDLEYTRFSAKRFPEISRSYQQTMVNCAALFAGNEAEISAAVNFANFLAGEENTNEASKVHNYPVPTKSTRSFLPEKNYEDEMGEWTKDFRPLSLEWYMNATRDCASFRESRGYITSSLTQEEEEFPIAFSMLVFKDLEMVERLLRGVYRPQNRYCIHVDAKADEKFFTALQAVVACFRDNVRMSSRRVDVQWGTFTVLEPELICMQDLLDMDKETNTSEKNRQTWKYFINLTGQEFPLKTNHALVKILKAFKGANNEEGTRIRANYDRWPSVPPHGIIPTKGGVHTLLNRATVKYILHNVTARDFINWLRSTETPDETLFASINYNPQLNIPGTYNGNQMESIPPLTRYKMWYGQNCFSGQVVRGICILSSGDLPRLGESPHLFANKFYLHQDRVVIGCLEEKIFNDTRDEFLGTKIFETTFYSQQDFVLHQVPGDPFR